MNPTATLMLDRDSLWLSDSLTATLRVEGLAPLAVTMSKEMLQPESAADWRVRPVGAATISPLPDGRAAWALKLRLDPYVPGETVPVAFAPLTVRDGAGRESLLAPPPTAVKVQTAIRDPKASDVRPITGLIDPPPSPPADALPLPAVFAGGGLVVILAAAVVVRRRRPVGVPPAPPAVRLEKLADRWAANAVTVREFAEQLAEIVRAHLESRFAIPATRRATGELDDDAPVDRFKAVLDWCDGVKFGGGEPPAAAGGEMLARARDLLALQAGTSSPSSS